MNKQYSQAEYTKLTAKIVEHMVHTGEWGEFFPMKYSPFPYNETMAQEAFPLTQDKALKQNLKWREMETTATNGLSARKTPEDAADVLDNLVDQVFCCRESGKNFRVIKPELQFYQKMKLPLPRFHPDLRHARRMRHRNLQRLHRRSCTDCGLELESSFSPNRPEPIYCEKCFQQVAE